MKATLKSFSFFIVVICSLVFANISDGDRAYDQGNYEEAIRHYSAVLEQNQTSVEALYKLAKATTLLAGTKTASEAEALFTQAAVFAREALALDPNEAEAHFELARALGRLAQFKGILESLNLSSDIKRALEKTIDLDPNHDGAHHALALWHLEVPWIAGGRSAQIRPLFDQAIALNPDAITHYADYAEALIRLEDKANARVQLEKALSLPSNNFGDEEAKEKAQELLRGL